MMDELSTSRRSAVVGILATVAALQTGGSLARPQDAANSTASGATITAESEDKTRWGTDSTRDLLSSELDLFFGGATGSYIAVRDQDKNKLRPNGEYLLADQIRLPLYGIAAPKIVESDGSSIYQAFITGNPYVRTFIKTDPTGAIEGVALADAEDIIKNGKVVDIQPRLTIFYRKNSAPADLRAEAEKVMKTFWSQEPPAPTMHDNSIKVIEHKLGNFSVDSRR
jgi:hypothetical protein